MEGAHEYLVRIGDGSLDTKALEESAGVGVVISPEQLRSGVAALLDSFKPRLVEERYRFNVGILLGEARKTPLRWADGVSLKREVDGQVEALLGPKTEEDMKKPEKKKPAAPPAAPAAAAATESREQVGEGLTALPACVLGAGGASQPTRAAPPLLSSSRARRWSPRCPRTSGPTCPSPLTTTMCTRPSHSATAG